MDIKVCSKCGYAYEISEFGKRRDSSDGLKNWCRSCMNAYNKTKYVHSIRKPKKERDPIHERNRQMIIRYGISNDDYIRMYNEQNGCCYICGAAKQMFTKKGLLIDHDHKTMAVRKLLCHKCNVALGQAGDSISRLKDMVSYLEMFK